MGDDESGEKIYHRYYPVKVCVQNLRESARKIYQRLEEQSELGSGWKAESYLIRGKIIK